MKIVVTFFFLFVSLLALADERSQISSCELNASPRAHVLARLIKIGIEREYLTIDEVTEFLASRELYNPYTRNARSIESHDLKIGFEKTAIHLTATDISQLKATTQAYLLNRSEQQQDIIVAKHRTQQILKPEIVKQLEVPGFLMSRYPMGLTWYNGRPMFLARMDIDDRKSQSNRSLIVALDPFHRRVTKRVRPIQGTEGTGRPSGNLEFYMKSGIPYAVDYAQNLFINLDRKEKAEGPVLGLNYSAGHYYTPVSALAKGKDFAMMISLADDRHGLGYHLVAVDFWAPRSDPRVLRQLISKHSLHPPVTYSVDDNTYVAYAAADSVHLYDATADRMLEPIQAKLDGEKWNHVWIYSDRGEQYLVLAERTSKESFQIRIINLETRKDSARGRFKAPQDFGFVIVDGVPHLHFFDEDNLVMVNLRTRSADRTPVPNTYSTKQFEWSGRKFLLWSGKFGDLQIFDFSSRTLMSLENFIPLGAREIVPFEFKGHIYALAYAEKQWPYLLRLTSDGAPENQ